MAFKMKGHELPGPHQRKGAPTKFIGLIAMGINAIASAAKKNREKTKALREQAKESMKSGVEGASAAGGQAAQASAPQAKQATAKQASSEGFKANLKGVKGK